MLNKFALPLAIVALLGTAARGALTVQLSAGTPFSVSTVNDFSPNGFSMAGMQVTATFKDSTSQTVTWTATDAISGNALGTDWSLAESSDTFDHLWSLTNNTGKLMTGLLLEGGANGHFVFDAQGDGSPSLATTRGRLPSADPNNPKTGTLGSQFGGTFDPFDNSVYGMSVTATYVNAVQLGAASPVGDLWTTLRIDFGTNNMGSTGLLSINGFQFQFYADTDLFGDSQTPPVVPEPNSLAIVAGLGLMFACCNRRSRLPTTPARGVHS